MTLRARKCPKCGCPLSKPKRRKWRLDVRLLETDRAAVSLTKSQADIFDIIWRGGTEPVPLAALSERVTAIANKQITQENIRSQISNIKKRIELTGIEIVSRRHGYFIGEPRRKTA